jgi:ubiquitin-protein ligase
MEIDNYVSDNYKTNKDITEFLITNAYYALNCARSNTIFEPVPDNWSIIENKVNKSISVVIKTIKNAYNDAEIIEKLNENTYTFIKFILKSNKMLIKLQYFANKNDSKYSNLENIVLLNVIHTELIEDKLKGKTTRYLYHGSPYENWYSIMRNGLKIGSKNKYFINGAAYGEGIYLSNNFHTSLQYSNVKKNQIIISIFEVVDKPEWKKTANIFVINDEESLLLRYLLVVDNPENSKNELIFKSIDNFLNGLKNNEIENKETGKKTIETIHNKRLMKEYQMIMKQSPDKLGFNIKLLQEDKLNTWMIYVNKPDNEKLEKQMKRLKIDAIEIEITFKDNYPLEPPFIRIVYPHFKFHSGHITIGGSLCMEMLTNQGWMPSFNVENVITQIKMAISDGNGEIDEANYNKRYTMTEAIDSFKRVLATHGWV